MNQRSHIWFGFRLLDMEKYNWLHDIQSNIYCQKPCRPCIIQFIIVRKINLFKRLWRKAKIPGIREIRQRELTGKMRKRRKLRR